MQQMTAGSKVFFFFDIVGLVLVVSSYSCKYDLPETLGKPLPKITQLPLMVAVHRSKIPLPKLPYND